MDATSKILAFINVLLVLLLALFWHRCNEILMDSNRWLQCHSNNDNHCNDNQLHSDNPTSTGTQILRSGSSVWCQGTNNTDRTCHFHYLCFAPATDSFVFFHGPESIINGVPEDRFSPAILDLSSVPNHNTQYFHYVDMPVNGLDHFQEVTMYHGSHFMFNRFNPSNLMHVFHDDLLPVFHTLLQRGFLNLENMQSSTRLVFLEGWLEGEYFDMYRWLSREEPLLKDDFTKQGADSSLICFEDAYLGISKDTTWYQYGFEEPQGAVPNTKVVTAREIRIFTNAFLRSLTTPVDTMGLGDQFLDQHQNQRENLEDQDPVQSPSQPQACLFVRDNNRLILNEADLISAIAHTSGLITVKISLDDLLDDLYPSKDDSNPNVDDSDPNMGEFNLNMDKEYLDTGHTDNEYKTRLGHFLHDIQRCQIVVGMHGSLLASIMFLNPGSIVIELFPYAVNPDHYTPYKTLSNLPGMQIIYKSWRNSKEENSVSHPDGAPEQGGIKHLSEQEQKRIMGSSEVPRHLCCSDPEWLFRIYQDTVVDIPSFRETSYSALIEKETTFETEGQRSTAKDQIDTFETKAVPGVVQDATCDRVYDNENIFGIKLSWKPPMNLEYFKNVEKRYEVWIQEMGNENYKAFILEMTEYVFTEGLDGSKNYRVWVRCLVGDKVGQFVPINSC